MNTAHSSRFFLPGLLLGALILLGLAAYAGFHVRGASSKPATQPGAPREAAALADVSAAERARIEAVVRAYILDHPEILPEAMQRLETKQAEGAVPQHRDALVKAFGNAVLGNPNGDVTLMEFSDYACGYCRKSVADVDRLIADDPKLRVVVREIPILSPASETAARAALAAALQDKYGPVHKALFDQGNLDQAKISAVLTAAGADMAKINNDANSAAVTKELQSNMQLAQALRVNGTPAWVVGDRVLAGAVGYDELKRAIADARQAHAATSAKK